MFFIGLCPAYSAEKHIKGENEGGGELRIAEFPNEKQ